MPQEKSVVSFISESILKVGPRILSAKLRYGSVFYLGFGQYNTQKTNGGKCVSSYSLEIEFGSDEWIILIDNRVVADSDFIDRDNLGEVLRLNIVGKELQSILLNDNNIDFNISGKIKIVIKLTMNPASGFSLAFSNKDDEQDWETINGLSIV
jgi:hypothetical protein